jgi:osmoprotectant transport system ATP-binding protein
VKLGDRIVVFDVGARVVQYDTPQRILAAPAEQYVADFVGAGATLKQLTLTRVADVDLLRVTTAEAGSDAAAAWPGAGGRRRLRRRPRRPRAADRLAVGAELSRVGTVPADVDPRLPVVGLRATLNDALDTMLAASQGGVVVTGRRDTLAG